MPRMPPAIQGVELPEGVHAKWRPRIAVASDQGTASIASIPNNAPPAFARQEANISPRTRCAQEVVMPHVGQGAPTRR